MCGIFGIIKNHLYSKHITEYILNGLEQLQNRGYDSAGICYIYNNEYKIYKYATIIGKETAIERLNKIDYEQYFDTINIGFGHNRWATHGIKNDINAHPHQSFNHKFVIVHNGIIENYLELRNICIENGFKFKSQTDTEVIVNYIEYIYNNQQRQNIIECIEECMKAIKGTYGCILQCIDEPNVLYTFRNGSPILIGNNDGLVIITSEQSGFCNYIQNYITLKNNDICKIEYNNDNIKIITKEVYNDIKNVVFNENIQLPSQYKHWTIKEIYEQPTTVLNAINNGGRIKNEYEVQLGGLQQYVDKLKKVKNIIILGCGSSFYAGLFGKYFFRKLCNFNTIQVIDGAEFEIDDIVKKGPTAIIFISQSGETKDLYRCIECIKDTEIITIGIVNVIDSLIAREVNCGIYCNAGKEIGVASTKSFTSQVVCLSLIAIWFSSLHYKNKCKSRNIIQDLNNLSFDIKKTIEIMYQDKNKLQDIVQICNQHSLFILGKGTDEIASKEGSLKIKEITYIHSEGYSSSSLKHGPFALLDENVPVILLNLEHKFIDKINSCYEEIKCRNSPIIYITNNKCNYSNGIIIPYNSTYNSLLGVIVLQILAYEISIYKGINPDIPKNLAKVVSVD